jgi:hypothetical protein
MDPFMWALAYWLGVAGFVYYAVQKAIELWPVDVPMVG